jgi:hypothetical protein
MPRPGAEAKHACRNVTEQTPMRVLEQRTKSEPRPGPRRKTVALSFIDSLAAADKSQRGKEKTDS